MLASVRSCVLFIMTHNVCDTTDDGPWVHDTLPTSDHCSSLCSSVIKTPDHLSGNDFSFLLLHLETYTKNHQHMIHAIDAHRIYVTNSVATCYATLHVGIINQGIEEIRR
jgi:hypothetical protein